MEPSGRAADGMGRTETDNADADPSPGAEQSAAISAVTTGADAAEPPIAVRETLSTVEEASDPDVPAQAVATDSHPAVDRSAVAERALGKLCEQIGAKLGSVSERDCSAQNLAMTNGWSVQGRSIAFKLFSARDTHAGGLGRVLLIVCGYIEITNSQSLLYLQQVACLRSSSAPLVPDKTAPSTLPG